MLRRLISFSVMFIGGCGSSAENPGAGLEVVTLEGNLDNKMWREEGGNHEGRERLLVSADGKKLAFDFGDGNVAIINAAPRRIELQKMAPDRPVKVEAGPRYAASKYYNSVVENCYSRSVNSQKPYGKTLIDCQSEIWEKTGVLTIKVGEDFFTVDIINGRVFVAAN